VGWVDAIRGRQAGRQKGREEGERGQNRVAGPVLESALRVIQNVRIVSGIHHREIG